MDSRDAAVLSKISAEASVITEMISSYDYNAFINDEKTKRAVCMTLINIGEMVKLLTDEIKRANPLIPWRSIAGLRDVTAHSYQTLRMEDIWETVVTDIPKLQEQVRELL
jgi:uncharacterized protein with HEPN domain